MIKRTSKISSSLVHRYCLVSIAALFLLSFAFINNTSAHRLSEVSTDSVTTLPSLPIAQTDPVEVIPHEFTKPLLFHDIKYIKYDNKEDIQKLFDDAQAAIHLLQNELECPLYTAKARLAMERELQRVNVVFDKVQNDLNTFYLWEEKLEEYNYATRTWQYLKDMGYSDVACAGIIGNLMAECGGHTLALDPYLYDKSGQYYGMFQWSKKWYPAADGLCFDEQLDYFKETVYDIFEDFGKNYYSGFTHNDFNELDSPRDAALAFAQVYERCSSKYYERRQNFAEIAYQYFVLDFKENFYE